MGGGGQVRWWVIHFVVSLGSSITSELNEEFLVVRDGCDVSEDDDTYIALCLPALMTLVSIVRTSGTDAARVGGGKRG